jgi:hypothetical protein
LKAMFTVLPELRKIKLWWWFFILKLRFIAFALV